MTKVVVITTKSRGMKKKKFGVVNHHTCVFSGIKFCLSHLLVGLDTKDGQIDSPVMALVASGTALGVVAVNFMAGHAALLYHALSDPESEARGFRANAEPRKRFFKSKVITPTRAACAHDHFNTLRTCDF